MSHIHFERIAKEFAERLDYLRMNPVCRGLVKRPEDWRWSSYNDFSLDKAVVEACHRTVRCVVCPIRVDYARLPEGYRG